MSDGMEVIHRPWEPRRFSLRPSHSAIIRTIDVTHYLLALLFFAIGVGVGATAIMARER